MAASRALSGADIDTRSRAALPSLGSVERGQQVACGSPDVEPRRAASVTLADITRASERPPNKRMRERDKSLGSQHNVRNNRFVSEPQESARESETINQAATTFGPLALCAPAARSPGRVMDAPWKLEHSSVGRSPLGIAPEESHKLAARANILTATASASPKPASLNASPSPSPSESEVRSPKSELEAAR